MVALLAFIGLVACSRAPKSFEMEGNLELELVASEPQVTDPIAIAFDEFGRMYVVEMTGYPEGTDPPRSQVKLLEDRDADGRFETSQVFLDGLHYPTTVLPWNGGVLVGNPPDILFCKDTTGDGKADVRKVLFTGFEVGNPQHNFNSLVWGLDSWVYGASGGNAGTVSAVERSGKPVSIRRRDFRLRPDTGEFETTAFTATGYGVTFDAWGHLFTTHNMYHVQQVVMFERYLARNPYLGISSTLQEISDHERVSKLFPISAPETRHNHPEQAGYFSGSSGITFYGGGAFPQEFNDNLFVGDVVTNLVHRDVLSPKGATFFASRGKEGAEFLASRDNWFRPTALATGPEGALYVVDMQRAVIEHPEWIPDAVEKNLDLRAGEDKGRIYRVVPAGGLKPRRVNLGRAAPAELVQGLEDTNMWWRQTAQRLLVEGQDVSAVPALSKLLTSGGYPLARLHALWTLHALGALQDEQVLAALDDPEPGVRENAVRIAEERAKASRDVAGKLRALAADGDARVRFQVALSLGEIRDGSEEALMSVALRDVDDPWTRLAVASALGNRDLVFLQRLLSEPPSEGRLAMFRLLASTIAARGSEKDLAAALRALAGPRLEERWVIAGMDGLAEGFARAPQGKSSSAAARSLMTELVKGASVSLLRAAWPVAARVGLKDTPVQKRALARAASRALDGSLSLETRLEEIRLLEYSDYATHGPTVLQLTDPGQPSTLQAVAVNVVAKWADRKAVGELIRRWRQLSPQGRKNLVNLILRNADFHLLLIEAMEQGDIRFGELALDLEQRRRLLRRSSEDVMRRAALLFGDEEYSNRSKMVSEFLEVVKMRGDSSRGERVFLDNCAKCHALQGRGGSVGPDLSHIYTKSAETLLTEILDPNAVVEDRYISYNVTKKNGTLASGLIKEETATTITLTSGENDQEVIHRSDIASMVSSGISLMPEGLEQGLDRHKLADLIAFLQKRAGESDQPRRGWIW